MHQIQATITALDAALRDAADANPVFLSAQEKASAVLELGRIETRVEELRLRVLAVAQDVADEVGARDPGTWLVAQEIADGPAARKQLRLAQALKEHPVVQAGLAEGRFSLEHAQVIIQALEDLPEDLDTELSAGLVTKAEAHLCDLATRHRPSDLRRLARHLLEVVAPEVAEEAEARAIARLEAHAEAKATLSITPLGDGTSRLFALVPEAVGQRLRTYLDSFAQPRITALETDGRTRPRNRIMADALGQLLECIDPDHLPAHGGDATTVIVTIPLHHLQRELGVAHLGTTPITTQLDTAQLGTAQLGTTGTLITTRPSTADLAGTPISAGEARRLACTAGIIPAILDGKSEPLDLGRTRRLFTPAQRKALKIRDQHCRAEG